MASELSAGVLETSITRDNVWLKTKEKKAQNMQDLYKATFARIGQSYSPFSIKRKKVFCFMAQAIKRQ